jgi:hypothetical protein
VIKNPDSCLRAVQLQKFSSVTAMGLLGAGSSRWNNLRQEIHPPLDFWEVGEASIGRTEVLQEPCRSNNARHLFTGVEKAARLLITLCI